MIRLLTLPVLVIAAAILFLLIVTSSAEGSPRSVKATICEVFGPRTCHAAVRVALCETGGTLNPYSRGRAGERGIFQIHPVHFHWLDERLLWLPGYNSLIAYRLSRGGRDWSAWSCRP